MCEQSDKHLSVAQVQKDAWSIKHIYINIKLNHLYLFNVQLVSHTHMCAHYNAIVMTSDKLLNFFSVIFVSIQRIDFLLIRINQFFLLFFKKISLNIEVRLISNSIFGNNFWFEIKENNVTLRSTIRSIMPQDWQFSSYLKQNQKLFKGFVSTKPITLPETRNRDLVSFSA